MAIQISDRLQYLQGGCAYLNSKVKSLWNEEKISAIKTFSLFKQSWHCTQWTLWWVGIVSVCVCAQQKRPWEGRRLCGDRKSTGAQTQTNKAQAAVIKSSLVLVMYRNAAERWTALSFRTDHSRTVPPCYCGPLLRSPLGFHLSWHVQEDECFGSI